MIYHQSVFERWLIEDKSVQAVITSPPYWGLRHYDIPDINIGGWRGQYGLEPTVQDYVAHTLLWVKEAWRVLRDDGVFFLNIGDTYSGGNGAGYKQSCSKVNQTDGGNKNFSLRKLTGRIDTLPPGCLLDIPARVSIALVDMQGWIKRNNIIWHKPNGMPESVTSRFSKKHESIFMFTKQSKYYFDLDAVKVPSKTYGYDKRDSALVRGREKGYDFKIDAMDMPGRAKLKKGRLMPPIGGKKQSAEVCVTYSGNEPETQSFCNPGDVWSIPTMPSSEKHFAMWPEKLVERMVLCSTKKGDTVLDPFCGSGTTLKVAEELGRHGLGIDLGYKDVQARRMTKIQRRLI